MTTTTPVPTIVADLPPIIVPPALAYAADRLLADLAVDPARLLRAAALMDDCERLADGRWICPASDGKHAYHITHGLCNCPDAEARDARRCKHALAVALHQLVERFEAEALDPTPPPMAGGAEIPLDAIPRFVPLTCTTCGTIYEAASTHYTGQTENFCSNACYVRRMARPLHHFYCLDCQEECPADGCGARGHQTVQGVR